MNSLRAIKPGDVPETMEGAAELETSGSYEKAAQLYVKLLKPRPQDIKIIARLMIVYRKLKNYTKELVYIEKAIKIQQGKFDSRQTHGNNINLISKKLNLMLGHTDKKGNKLVMSDEMKRLQKRKAVVLAKIK